MLVPRKYKQGDVHLAVEIHTYIYIYIHTCGQALIRWWSWLAGFALSPVSTSRVSLQSSLLLLENAISQITAASQGRVCGEFSWGEEICPAGSLAQSILKPASGAPGLSSWRCWGARALPMAPLTAARWRTLAYTLCKPPFRTAACHTGGKWTFSSWERSKAICWFLCRGQALSRCIFTSWLQKSAFVKLVLIGTCLNPRCAKKCQF